MVLGLCRQKHWNNMKNRKKVIWWSTVQPKLNQIEKYKSKLSKFTKKDVFLFFTFWLGISLLNLSYLIRTSPTVEVSPIFVRPSQARAKAKWARMKLYNFIVV